MRITGDPSSPRGTHLCERSIAGVDFHYHPDRVNYPLKRIGERGEGKWERISWEKATDEIAQKLDAIRSRFGPEALAVLGGGNSSLANALFVRWCNLWGTPNYFWQGKNCGEAEFLAESAIYGYVASIGNPPIPGITKCTIVWGENTWASRQESTWLNYMPAKKTGMKLIVVDPRLSETAKEADIWVQLRPGTDGALALGMLNVMIREKLYDTDFVENWTHGFDVLSRHVDEYTPAKVAEITWVNEATIIEAARLIATNKPSAIFTFVGLNMGSNSIAVLRSLGLLLAITGNIDRVGSNFIKSSPRTETIRLPEELLERQMGADKFPLLSGPAAIFPAPNPVDVINTIITGEPYPIKALLTGSNPVTALEDSKRALEALMKLELLVVFELFMTPTAEFADYVLPITWFLESDAIVEYAGLNFIASRKRVLQPRGEAREEGEVLLEILNSLGIVDKLPFSNYREYLDYRLRPLKLRFDEFTQVGYIVNPNIERKYEGGLLRADGKPGFNTPSGKVELYSTILEKYGYDPLPKYKEPVPSPYTTPDLFRDYPFIMITGARSLPFYHGLGLQIPGFRKLHPEPTLEINPQAAERLGISEGDRVAIEVPGKNDRVHRKAHIVKGLHNNVVCAEGHWYLPEEKHDQQKRLWDANINVLTSLRDDYDPVVGGSGCRCLLCRISRAST